MQKPFLYNAVFYEIFVLRKFSLGSPLSNINDNGNSNEKKRKLKKIIKKTRVRLFKNMGVNIPGGNIPGVGFTGGEFD